MFDKPADYAAFEKILAEAHKKTGFRIAAYCLMPDHWHLLSWPRTDGELSEVMRWITRVGAGGFEVRCAKKAALWG